MIDPVQLLTSMGVLDESARQVRFKSVLFLGAPGAGKGVQGTILKSIPGFYHFSSGEVFRRIGRFPPVPQDTSPNATDFSIELPITYSLQQ